MRELAWRNLAMELFTVKVQPEGTALAREEQLAWKIAAVAADRAEVLPEVAEMIVNRLIDNAAVAVAAINTHAVITARDQALAHPRPGGATLIGCSPERRVHAEWKA